MSKWMDYFEALHCDGWLDDPTDRVQVVAIHAAGCSGGNACDCVPRLELRPADTPAVDGGRSNVVAGPGWIDMEAAQVG